MVPAIINIITRIIQNKIRGSIYRTCKFPAKGYNGGAIRLVFCDTAAKGATSAQELADALGVNVMAPTKAVFVDILGEMTVGSDPFTNDGKWIILNPRG